jgi:hypothetical protein
MERLHLSLGPIEIEVVEGYLRNESERLIPGEAEKGGSV